MSAQISDKLTIDEKVYGLSKFGSDANYNFVYLYNQKNIVRIGEFSNGSAGQPAQIKLPGNGSGIICTKKVTLPNGEEFIGIGIKPDILVVRNLNDTLYPLQYDSQLESAVKCLENKEL